MPTHENHFLMSADVVRDSIDPASDHKINISFAHNYIFINHSINDANS